jgi:DNA-binding GntR family transcriptional regulator
MAKIEYRTLNDRAYEQIKKGLISGAFRSGQTLVIRTLADAYGISTTPVREALQRLVAERNLELLPNRSIVVPVLSSERFIELVRIRRELEGLAGELAAPNFRPAHVAKLQTLIDAMDRTIREDNMWSQVGPFFNELTEDEGFVTVANEQHRHIIAALRDNDARAVRLHVSADIEVASDYLTPRLQKNERAAIPA